MLLQVATKTQFARAFTSRQSTILRQLGRSTLRNHHHASAIVRCHQHPSSCWMTTAGLMMALTSTTAVVSETFCQEDEDDTTLTIPPFDESVLAYDHYNGVTLHLDKLSAEKSLNPDEESANFAKNLKQAMEFWRAEQRKGVWVHVPISKAHLIPHCVNEGFNFHFVKDKVLILSQWLPQDKPSKLPLGPTHQVGIGALVLHPKDPSQMLVVQEKSGPAAQWNLWKMPTGLLDPGEDIPEAAARELWEETNLEAVMDGILCFRQAHRPSSASDLFFVCHLTLKDPESFEWKPCEDEIADIRWMPVEEYCAQERWQGSPTYETLNDTIRKASQKAQTSKDHKVEGMIDSQVLPLGFGIPGMTNALFKSQL